MSEEYPVEAYDLGIPDEWEIDRPIRAVISRMNQVGLPTEASCCGFDYRGQSSEKIHCAPYVMFRDVKSQAPRIMDILGGSYGWSLDYHTGSKGQLWILGVGILTPNRNRSWTNDQQYIAIVKKCWKELLGALLV